MIRHVESQRRIQRWRDVYDGKLNRPFNLIYRPFADVERPFPNPANREA